MCTPSGTVGVTQRKKPLRRGPQRPLHGDDASSRPAGEASQSRPVRTMSTTLMASTATITVTITVTITTVTTVTTVTTITCTPGQGAGAAEITRRS